MCEEMFTSIGNSVFATGVIQHIASCCSSLTGPVDRPPGTHASAFNSTCCSIALNVTLLWSVEASGYNMLLTEHC